MPTIFTNYALVLIFAYDSYGAYGFFRQTFTLALIHSNRRGYEKFNTFFIFKNVQLYTILSGIRTQTVHGYDCFFSVWLDVRWRKPYTFWLVHRYLVCYRQKHLEIITKNKIRTRFISYRVKRFDTSWIVAVCNTRYSDISVNFYA